MREFCTSGSVGGRGGQLPRPTRPLGTRATERDWVALRVPKSFQGLGAGSPGALGLATRSEGMEMCWPLRMLQEEGFYFVTSRCFQGRLLLRPSAEMNEVVGGVLA